VSRLSSLKIRGFKSIESLDLEMRPINVLIGPNGAGKSNFISFFRMLSEMMAGRLGLFVQRSGRASALLHYGPKVTDCVEGRFRFGQNGYAFQLVPTEDGRLVFEEERTYFEGDYYSDPIRPVLTRGHDESELPEAFVTDPNGIPKYVYGGISAWRVYHFHDTSAQAAVKQEHSLHDNEALRSDAGNLAAFLYLLRERHPQNYALVRATVRRIFPRFGDFALRPNPLSPERIRLEWREEGSDYLFGPHQLSDGTLRFVCLATLLLQPTLPTAVLIDEPELGLHPSALAVLAGLVRSASQRSQLILTTQSVTLLNEFEPEDVVVVERKEKADPDGVPLGRAPSVLRRIESSEHLDEWLREYAVGDLWETNVLGGRP
jgi:predicted ATPase